MNNKEINNFLDLTLWFVSEINESENSLKREDIF